ncbi:MAG: glycoside hydrolase family 3 C-terminal domain-containing protein [Gammaproteobacteria bacterium]|nr:glycoside hydrolase family 3 C-terminal domain-containing protein [Gammaproteobacteria bacterium]
MSDVLAYKNADLAVEERVADLIARMTLPEKLKQIGCIWSTELVENDVFVREVAIERLFDGIGHVTRIGATTGLTPLENARFANQIQNVLVEHSRLGIPAIIHEEAVAGFCARGATQYPQAIGLAATFAPDLVQDMAAGIRREMLAVGARHALSPVLDIARDPRWGRLEETYGEDPYLAGRMGVAFVRGLQGRDLREGVVATGKHFLGYGLSEGGMNHAPVHLGPRQLREVFAEPFSAAIREANLLSVMNSYSSVDGIPCGAAGEILQDLLRDELGFEGIVVADYYTLNLLIRHHRVAASKGDAAAMALIAGMDVELPALDCFGEPLREKVEAGEVDVSLVNRAVSRLLNLKFKLGLFENPYVDEELAEGVFDTAENRALARRLAEQSLVLLKNDDDLLPLKRGMKIALVGPTADDQRLMQGDYHYPAHAEIVYRREELNTDITPARSGAFQPGPYYVPMVTPRSALESMFDVTYEKGCEINDLEESGISRAVTAASRADVAVVCVGGKSGLLPDCTSGEFRDAADLKLTGRQETLIRAVAASGTPTVVVVIGGRGFDLSGVVETVGAVILAWLPGEEGGSAIANVLAGEVSPSGRLPVSLPRGVGQLPVYYNHKSGGGRSAPLGNYTDLSTKPLFPFGHGLSYASFTYENLRCPDTVDTHSVINVGVTIINDSDCAADEVVQLYVHDKIADVARPVQQLAGFARLSLQPQERRDIQFQVDISQLAYFNRAMEFVVDPGEVDVMLGASSKDIRCRKTVMVQGERRQLQQRQIVATQVTT